LHPSRTTLAPLLLLAFAGGLVGCASSGASHWAQTAPSLPPAPARVHLGTIEPVLAEPCPWPGQHHGEAFDLR
jgi:hypothetical protein